MRKTKTGQIIAFVIVQLLFATAQANDFPTQTRAEFVFACMAANGQSQEYLGKCSCTIDNIAEQMSHQAYVDAETVLRIRLMRGERAAIFTESAWANEIITNFSSVTSDAEIECF